MVNVSTNGISQLASILWTFEREHGLTASALLSPYKVSLNQMLIVAHLSQNEPLTVSELAQLTASDKSSISRTLSGLEKLGWIRKITGKVDKRQALIYLTAKGKTHSKFADEICSSLSQAMESALTASEKRQFISMLGKIITSLIESRNK